GRAAVGALVAVGLGLIGGRTDRIALALVSTAAAHPAGRVRALRLPNGGPGARGAATGPCAAALATNLVGRALRSVGLDGSLGEGLVVDDGDAAGAVRPRLHLGAGDHPQPEALGLLGDVVTGDEHERGALLHAAVEAHLGEDVGERE